MSEKNRDLIWVFGFLVVLVIVPLVMTWGLGGGYMPGMMGMMGFGWGFMVFVPIGFLVLIASGVFLLVTESKGTSRSASTHGRALDILKERYAKGEITRAQFLPMKKELEQ
ncbi:MAG: SHOCT domain-containing protein [Candidatus Bathyarchaeota archaeon]|nr:MAG: SHOCT domain-containing protein [Candidatus Bathyarchaeota archaeon]